MRQLHGHVDRHGDEGLADLLSRLETIRGMIEDCRAAALKVEFERRAKISALIAWVDADDDPIRTKARA